jgi:MFS transporter, DHA1 family, multidrug resistance protein
MYSLLYLPYPMTLWVASAFMGRVARACVIVAYIDSLSGPAIGPTLSGFAVVVKDFHWAFWIILWMSAPVFVAWLFFLPETSAARILLRRAERLRKLTGNDKIRSQTEIDRQGLTFGTIFKDAVAKPFEIMFKDPAVLFANVYTGLIYGIYYSWFEAFPLAYPRVYGFNIGETALVFLGILVGAALGIATYYGYLYWRLIPDILQNGLQAQEWRLRPAIFGVVANTISLFLWGKPCYCFPQAVC